MMALQVLQAAILLAKYSMIGKTLVTNYGMWRAIFILSLWLIRRLA